MKFCKHCGKEIIEKAEFCKYCGHATSQKEVKGNKKSFDLKTQIHKYKTFSKKKKILISMVVSVGILLIVTLSVLNYLSSPKHLIKTVHEAIIEDDYDKLSEFIFFEGTDKNIGKENAKALVKAIDEQDRLEEVLHHFQAQYDKKTSSKGEILNLTKESCYLVMDCYQITTQPYYIVAQSNLNKTELSYFNKSLSTIENRDKKVELGPFAYGKYDFEAVYANKFVNLQTEQQVYINHDKQEIDFYFEYDSIAVDNRDFPLESKIILNDEKMDESMLLAENEIGPIETDTDYTMEIITPFPWGDLSTEKHEVTDRHFYANYQPTEELLEQLSTSVNSFYHLLFDAFQQNKAEKLNFLNSELKESYTSSITGLYKDLNDYDIMHYRDVDEYGIADGFVDIVFDSELDEYVLSIYVMENSAAENQFYTDKIEDPHYEKNYHTFDLHYVEDKWEVRNIDFDNWENDHNYKLYEYDGDPVVLGKNQAKEQAKDDQKEDSDETTEITEATTNYINKLVEAINAGDYSIVEAYIQSGSSLEDMQQGLVERLSDNGTTQKVIDSEVTNIEKDGNNWKVDTNETIKIIYSSEKEETNDYNWTYTLVEEDGTFKLTNIE